MYRTNAVSRAPGDPIKGNAAMNGAARMRPAVIVFGRFTGPPSLRQRLQHELADGLECIENSIATYGDGFEVRRPLHPLAARKLLDEILAGVIGIGSDVEFRG